MNIPINLKFDEKDEQDDKTHSKLHPSFLLIREKILNNINIYNIVSGHD